MRTIRHSLPTNGALMVATGSWGHAAWKAFLESTRPPCGGTGCEGATGQLLLSCGQNGAADDFVSIDRLTPAYIHKRALQNAQRDGTPRGHDWEARVLETVHDLAEMYDIEVPGVYERKK